MSEAPVKKKKPKEIDPLQPLIDALREYERTSYYLATKGDFDFTMDDEAQEYFHSGDPMNCAEIMALRALRVETYGKPIPKGLHIDGLFIRTNERIRRNKLAKKGK